MFLSFMCRLLLLIRRCSDLYQRGVLPDEGQVFECQEGVDPVLSEIFEMDNRVAAFLLPRHQIKLVAQVLDNDVHRVRRPRW
jgi:hypothetical protein